MQCRGAQSCFLFFFRSTELGFEGSVDGEPCCRKSGVNESCRGFEVGEKWTSEGGTGHPRSELTCLGCSPWLENGGPGVQRSEAGT